MLEIQNLQKVVDGRTVIAITSFTIKPGQIVVLVAQPGSGAEILVNLLTGRIQPSAGTLRLAGFEPYRDHATLSQVLGVMFAEDAIYKNLGTLANLRFQARLYGLTKAHVDDVLTRVGLADQAHRAAGKLSPSLQRRLGFGRAILHTPSFLLLIEPFNRCDKTTVNLMVSQIQELADNGTAILVISSDLSRLSAVCDLVYELQDGDILERMHPPQEEEALRQPFKIPVKTEDTVLLVNPAEVLYADTGDGRTFLITAEGRLPTQYTLSELEERLKRSGFFRAHRSYLVNLQHVREVIPFTRNSFSLRLDDPAETQIPLSKLAAGELKELLGY